MWTVETREPLLTKAGTQTGLRRTKPPRHTPWRIIALIILLLAPVLALSVRQIYLTMTCAGLINSVDYTEVVHAPKGVRVVVQEADALDGGNPAALVQVRTHNQLDVLVLGCTTRQPSHPQLIQLFTQQGLMQGIAEISASGTLVTATLDTSPQMLSYLQPNQRYIAHEYGWQQGHFVSLRFPGVYPVTSRFEEEALERSAAPGQPWHDPVATAVQMSRDLLHFHNSLQTQLLSETQTTAIVAITEDHPHVVLFVTLCKMHSLWLVTVANTRSMTLTRYGTIDQPFETVVSSPIRFSGVSALIDGQTTATLLNHALTPIAQSNIAVQDNSTYASVLSYRSPLEPEPGVLLIESMPLPPNYGSFESEQIVLALMLLN